LYNVLFIRKKIKDVVILLNSYISLYKRGRTIQDFANSNKDEDSKVIKKNSYRIQSLILKN